MNDQNASQVTRDGLPPGVSIVLPILNEERFLAQAIAGILRQQYGGPLEVILAIGPSKDKTRDIAHSLAAQDSRIILVDNPTGRTANGLNLAIAKASYPVICRVDGHAHIKETYVAEAVELLCKKGAVNVGGIMSAVGTSAFEKAVATAMKSVLGVGSARFHIGGEAGPADTVYLGTFWKSAVNAVGGYDERFTRAQDWELNFRLRQAGGLIWFDPSLEVRYQPRSTIKALAKQYFEYGRWRRAVMRNHRGTVNLRYLAPPFAVLGAVFSIIFGLVFSNFFFIPAIGYAGLLTLGSIFIGQSLPEKIILPTVLATMHMSWGLGFLTSPPGLLPEEE